MNQEIILVDVLHSNDHGMIATPNYQALLYQRLLSVSTSETVICVEGINTGSKGLKPSDPQYSRVVNSLWPEYAHKVVKMPLYGADPRPSQEAIFGSLYLEMLRILDENIVLPNPPQSLEEALEWIRTEQCELQILGKPNAEVKALASKVYQVEKTWLRNYTNLAISLSKKRSKTIYIIAGLSHVLNLHLANGWPILWLTAQDPVMTPEKLCRAGMNLDGFLKIMMGIK